MQATTKHKVLGILLSFSLLTVGCQKPFEANGFVEVDQNFDKVAKDLGLDIGSADTVEVNEALEKTYASIADVEAIDIGSGTSGKLKGIKKIFNMLFGKLIDVFQKLRSKIQVAYEKIDEQLAQLDAQNPAHQALIAKFMEARERLERVEAKIDAAKLRVAEKFEYVLERLEDLRSRLSFTNPIHWIIDTVLFSVEAKLNEKLDEFMEEA